MSDFLSRFCSVLIGGEGGGLHDSEPPPFTGGEKVWGGRDVTWLFVKRHINI